MRSHLLRLSALAVLVAALAAVSAAAASAASNLTGQLSIVGPWQGRDAASFRAVLDGFTQQNPGVTVSYTAAAGDVASQVETAAKLGAESDLAVLPLPADQSALTSMARSGVLKSIDFAAPAVTSNYSFSWKLLGSVDNRLYGVFFRADNQSAFWYDAQAFKRLGVSAPTSWAGFVRLVKTLKGHAISPFALSGASAFTLPNLFQNLYLTFEGNHDYDALASGKLRWDDASVARVLSLFKSTFGSGIAGGTASLTRPYSSAVQDVFGSPMRAYLVPGGSNALPVLYNAKAVRPLSQFGAFSFPQLSAAAPARVLGDADAVVMAKDSPAARALVSYLATPEAAAIWAKQGGFFVSPNRKVALTDYAVPQMAQLARALAGANTFRFAIADTESNAFRSTMNLQLRRYLEGLDTRGDVMSRLVLAAGGAKA
jgi:ABC-type glycerol-3-phosphate transport system substrate-binding protein